MKVRLRRVDTNGAGCWAVSRGDETQYFANWICAIACAFGDYSASYAHLIDYHLSVLKFHLREVA